TRRHQDQEKVRADAEVFPLVHHDERAKALLRAGYRILEHRENVGVETVHLGLERHAEHAVAEIPCFRAVVREDGLVAFPQLTERHRARVASDTRVLALHEIEHRSILAVEALRALRFHALNRGRNRDALLLHLPEHSVEAESVPGLERAEVPRVAP